MYEAEKVQGKVEEILGKTPCYRHKKTCKVHEEQKMQDEVHCKKKGILVEAPCRDKKVA
jgi:hypothetical protein